MTQLDLPAETVGAQAPGAPRLGRKRDHSRDPEILDAAIEVLAETGYEGMTIEMVAARAKAGKATLYRRWPSKAELVLDAVACMKRGDVEAPLPDTGTLRGDLVALIKPRSIAEAEKKLQIMAGLASMLSRSPELADTAYATLVEPRAKVNRLLFQRAVDRGEITGEHDLETLSVVSASMASYRLMLLRKPVDREFLLSIIDGVILPALGLPAGEPR
ncbi:transcriptional regulator, TetR family [Agromyces sp. CF514]|uniref:TetR/AcrR family transcriptional regulator n=1 Tax=Agromyces sp. CF514 TaxID=1881031 RepID=UPI0008DEF5ED|nr:TetR/AcrR family transcriptional regulator [Agromyces sp. CF514]SFR91353.1 transcriptional regulator, TetR family [Agromyces sp. CF514]